MSIRVVVDSASDIPWDYADKLGVKVVPLSISYDDKVFKENREFDLAAHYSNYERNPDFLPKTAQPSPKEFVTVYNELIKEGAKDIIVVCISATMSGTMNSARLATDFIKDTHPEVKVHLVDSKNASYTEVFLVEEAITMIKKGEKVEKIISRLNELVPLLKTYIYIPNLRYLYLGGRISGTKYLLARLLRKKVITRVNEKGTNESAATVSNIDDGFEKMLQLTTKKFTKFPRKYAIVHANNEELAKELEKLLLEKDPKAKLQIILTKCTISTHTGPNAIALLSDFG
ncbi:MAG: DegV family protein [Candidatus Heimdallarchaeota archaeon]|nr:DegV family protein [Candidatus Heimdallarchaeota archaeon]